MDYDCFTLGLLKGAVEGDATAHFGSLLGFPDHLRTAEEAGLVDGDASPTPRGRREYERLGLSGLPPGRAYLWSDDVIDPILWRLNAGEETP